MHFICTAISIILLAGCRSVPAELQTERHETYIQNAILPHAAHASDRSIIFVINKNFCGSCTSHSVTLAQSSLLADDDVIVVSDRDIRDLLPDSTTLTRLTQLVIPLEVQQRKGFFSTMNRIYFIHEGHIETANYITDETISQVHRQLNHWVNE